MNTQPAASKLHIKAWALMIVIFLLGAVAGASLNGIFRSRTSSANQPVTLRNGDAYFDTLQKELNLTTQQASSIKGVISDAGNDYKGLCAEVRPRYDQVRDRARLRMRMLLTPEQQKRFDALVVQENCNCPEQKK